MNSAFFGFFGFLDFCPGSDSYRGSYLQSQQGDEILGRIGRGTRVPLQGAVDVVPLLGGAMVGG